VAGLHKGLCRLVADTLDFPEVLDQRWSTLADPQCVLINVGPERGGESGRFVPRHVVQFTAVS
jgi:hypothetical protein